MNGSVHCILYHALPYKLTWSVSVHDPPHVWDISQHSVACSAGRAGRQACCAVLSLELGSATVQQLW
jgi:hypothetical protein